MRDTIYAATMDYLTERTLKEAGAPRELSMTTDAFGSGLLDSMAFVELMTAVETKAGIEIDFLLVDPEKLETIGDLIDQLAGAAKPAAA